MNEGLLNKVLHGGCLDLLKDIETSSVDMICIDPPYKIEGGGGEGRMRSGIFHRNKGGRKLFNYEKAEIYISELSRVAKDNSHIYVFSNDKNLEDILVAGKKANLKLMNVIVLDKGNKVAFGWYMKQVEFVVLFRNKGKSKKVNDMSISNLIKVNFPKGKNRVHPSEKGVELLELFIKQSSTECDVILDCFGGSGSLAVACISTNRNFILMEKEWEYCEILNNRIEEALKVVRTNNIKG